MFKSFNSDVGSFEEAQKIIDKMIERIASLNSKPEIAAMLSESVTSLDDLLQSLNMKSGQYDQAQQVMVLILYFCEAYMRTDDPKEIAKHVASRHKEYMDEYFEYCKTKLMERVKPQGTVQ